MRFKEPNQYEDRRSPPRYGKVPLRGKSGLKQHKIHPRTDKRVIQEREYSVICAEIDEEAKEAGNLECFFCGEMCVKSDHHHLDGREADLLTKKEWIVRVHRKCHTAYHSSPIESLSWFNEFLLRLNGIS